MAIRELARKEINIAMKMIKGTFAVNKPKNQTYVDVVNMVALQIGDDVGFPLLFHGVPVSHGGMLEYSAGGVLICALGMTASRKMNYFATGEKKYNLIVKLGQATDTHDALGIITEEKSYDHISKPQLEEALQQFIGPILMRKPCLKIMEMDGKVIKDINKKILKEVPAFLPVCATSICCTSFNLPYISLDVTYTGRFYIRTFVDELGKLLGSCAHIQSMERTSQGIFTINDALLTYQWSWSNIQKAIQIANPKVNKYVNEMRCAEMQENKKKE